MHSNDMLSDTSDSVQLQINAARTICHLIAGLETYSYSEYSPSTLSSCSILLSCLSSPVRMSEVLFLLLFPVFGCVVCWWTLEGSEALVRCAITTKHRVLQMSN